MLSVNCENPSGTLTALRMINATNSQNKTLSSPPEITASPATNKAVHQAAGDDGPLDDRQRQAFHAEQEQCHNGAGQNVKTENRLDSVHRHVQQI